MTNAALREFFSNLVLALVFIYFLIVNMAYLSYEFRVSVFVQAILNLLLVGIAVTRRLPYSVSLSFTDTVISLVGSYSSAFMIGNPLQSEWFVLQIIQTIGVCISIAGVCALNKSFGLLPANRGVVRSGLYKIVRHPIYAGYIISFTCFVIQNYTERNLLLYIVFLSFETMRLLREEKFLSQFSEYVSYMQQVRWRIIPYVW